MDTATPSAAEIASDVSNALSLRAAGMSADIYQLIVREIPQLRSDRGILLIAEKTASYIDRVSEEVVSAYESEKENWLRNLGAARAARVRALLATEPVDVDSSEAILGYRLRQHHLGLVCWLGEAEAGGDGLARLEHATLDVAGRCEGRPLFLPQDEASAWAWLPLGTRDTFDLRNAEAAVAGAGAGVRFALGAIASGTPGFRRTHRQALSAQAVALAGPT